jgi:polysaccharide biosynthesis/export protein
MEMRIRFAYLILPIALVTGCASRQTVAVPPDLAAAAAPASIDRRIGPDDLITITVLDAPELGRSVRVSGDGSITMALLGNVPAAGQTPQELETSIADRLRGRYMVDPQVTVDVTEPRSRSIYVLGDVNKPGAYPATGTDGLTVLRALALGEGLKSTAAKSQARVIRGVASGQRVEIPVDVGQVLAGSAPDVPLLPDDILFVPGSSGKSIAQGVLNAVVRMVTLRGVF